MRASLPIVAALLLAAPAAAQAPVSPATLDNHPATLAFDAAGNAVATWQGSDGTPPDVFRTFTGIGARAPGGDWRGGQVLPATVTMHAVAVSASGRIGLATVRQTPVEGNRSRSTLLVNAARTTSVRFGRPVRLDGGPATRVSGEGPYPSIVSPKAAFAPRDQLLVAWQRTIPRERSGVWLAGNTRDGRGIRPRRLGPYGGEPFLAVAEDGTGILAWRRGRRVLARERRAGGGWGPVERVATVPAGAQIEHVALDVAAGRRAVVAVVATHRSAAGIRTRPSVHVRVTGSGWRQAVLGDFTWNATAASSHVSTFLRAIPFITSEGRMRVAWPRQEGTTMQVALTELMPERSGVGTGPPSTVSDPGWSAALEDVATGPEGRFAVVTFDFGAGHGSPGLYEGGAFIRPATAPALLGARAAYDPSTGRPLVIWSQGTVGAYRVVAYSPT